jgi:hypothetical protein
MIVRPFVLLSPRVLVPALATGASELLALWRARRRHPRVTAPSRH